MAKPFLRWAGSKRKQIPRLRNFWQPSYSRYVEPFAGSACFFFDIQPSCAIISDKNSELIGTYETVRDDAETVYDRIVAIPRDKTTYYAERAKDPSSLSRIRRAVRFIYLNRNCFNGIYRTNTRGGFNVPFATSRAGTFVSREEFLAAAELLQRATFRSCDFGATLRHAGAGDFVYLDPPYVVESRRVFREYGARPFDTRDLNRLGTHLDKLNARGAHFLVSYADCREARQLANRWHSCRMRLRRYVAGFTGARRLGYELLITNIEHSRAAAKV